MCVIVLRRLHLIVMLTIVSQQDLLRDRGGGVIRLLEAKIR
jgi:hypothetical protein